MSESARWAAAMLGAALGVSFALSLGLTAMAIRVAPRLGLVDRPGGANSHKTHRRPTPYGGGTAMMLAAWGPAAAAVVLASALSESWIAERFGELARAYAGGLAQRGGQLAAVFAGALALHVLGLYDDVRAQGPWVKLTAIVGVAVWTAMAGGVAVAQFLGPATSIVLTVLWITIITNSLNFLDNMDGLSAGVAGICAMFLVICGLAAGQLLVPALGCLFLGAMAGFLVFNFPPAHVFMGDAGSLVLGYMLAVLSAMTTYYDSAGPMPPYALAMPLAILAVPLYDFTSVVVIRLMEGRNPLRGDRRHFSHRLVERGLSRRSAVLTIYLATAATGALATLLPGAGLRETLTVLAVVLMVLLIIAILEAPLRRDA